MMLSKITNINNMRFKDDLNPIEERLSLVEDILKDSTFYPQTVSYKDIDEAFNDWVENELRIVFEEEVVPTYALFSNQRFTEYMQMWENVDENRNIKMNFKVIARDVNPNNNTMYAKASNVPHNKKYLMKTVEGIDKQGKKCKIELRMSQPMTIDFLYKLTIVTNKFELINDFNALVRNKFKTIQCYLFPKGHPMPMKLNNVVDDSDYTLEDRQYFSQTFEINLIGYIIQEEDFETIVKPMVKLKCITLDGGKKERANVEIEEVDEGEYYNQPLKITIGYEIHQSDTCDFIIDTDMMVNKINLTNIRTYSLKINDEKVNFNENLLLKEGDKITFKINRVNNTKFAKILVEGYNPNVVYDRKNDIPESVLDEVNISKEILESNES